MDKEKEKKVIETLSKMNGEDLLSAYNYYVKNFNPIDDDMCNKYNLVRAEILKRLNGKN